MDKRKPKNLFEEFIESYNNLDKLIEFEESQLEEKLKFSSNQNELAELHKNLANLYAENFKNGLSKWNNEDINENNFPIIKTIHYHYKRALNHQSFIIKKLIIYNKYSNFISLIKPNLLNILVDGQFNDINLIENQKVLKEAINISEKYRSNILSPEYKKIFQDLCSILYKKIIKNTNNLLKEAKRIHINIHYNNPFDKNKYKEYKIKYKEYKEDLFKYIEMSKTRSLVDVINSKNEGRIVFDESIANDNSIIREEIKLLDKLEDEIANNEKLEIDKSSDSNNTRGFKTESEFKKTTEELKLLESRKNELEKQKRELLDKLYKYPHIKARLSQINGDVISINQLQSLLGNQISDDTAIFQYYLSDEIFIINVITKNGVETLVEENSFKLKKLNYWIKLYNECFKMFCSKYTSSNTFIKHINKIKNDYPEIGVYDESNSGFNNFVLDLLGKELYKYLVESAEEFIKGKKRLMFISQSYLHNFAFNILQKDNKFLIDTMELYKLPSASIWESLKDKSGFNFENITAFAVSKYIKLKELDGSRTEINNIENCFGFDNYLNKVTEDEVKPEVIKKYMKNANILSISGHGYSEKADSGYVYIDKKSNEDLKLSISRIFSSFPSFEKNSLVVLSICHGGFQILTGEEISGINSVFLMLGAGAVISNLVPLWDDVGAEFSKNLYKNLSENLIDGKKDDLKDKLEIFYESLRELKIKNDGIENWAFLEFQGNPNF